MAHPGFFQGDAQQTKKKNDIVNLGFAIDSVAIYVFRINQLDR